MSVTRTAKQRAKELSGDPMRPRMDPSDARRLLGPGHEHMEFHAGPVGRARLIRSLSARLGEGFGADPRARQVLKDHEMVTQDTRLWLKLKEQRHG